MSCANVNRRLNSNNNNNNNVYAVYATAVYAGQTWSVLSTVMLGSPSYNLLLRMLGVTFEGRAYVFEAKMYEHKFITLADKTLLDQSPGVTDGHYVVYDKITIGPCKVGGVLHEGTFAANAVLLSDESGPWRISVGTYGKDDLDVIITTNHEKEVIDSSPDENIFLDNTSCHVQMSTGD